MLYDSAVLFYLAMYMNSAIAKKKATIEISCCLRTIFKMGLEEGRKVEIGPTADPRIRPATRSTTPKIILRSNFEVLFSPLRV
jgi:hypothetical protein